MYSASNRLLLFLMKRHFVRSIGDDVLEWMERKDVLCEAYADIYDGLQAISTDQFVPEA